MSAENTDKRKIRLAAIVAAAVGGTAPNLMNLGILLTGDGELPGYTYYLGSLIFFLMGGVVCLIWREKDLIRAFYLGLGLPSIIQIGMSDLSDRPAPESPPAHVIEPVSHRTILPFSLTSTAIAQAPAMESEPRSIDGRKILIEIDRRFFTQTSIRNQLAILYNHHEQKSSTRVPIPMLSTFVNEQKRAAKTPNRVFLLQLDVPETAKRFRIQVEKQYSRLQILSTIPRSAEVYQLRYAESKWSGLKRAFGQRSASSFRVELHRRGLAPISFDNHATFTKKDERYNWFKWETFVVAKDDKLEEIDEVKYRLHETFPPQSPATDRSTKFMLSMNGWGSFWIHAIVYHSNKKQTHIQYYLDLRKRKNGG